MFRPDPDRPPLGADGTGNVTAAGAEMGDLPVWVMPARAPYTPLTLATIAAEARGEAFPPLRKTPMHGWHQAQGASFEPVGLWRRPFAYSRAGEARHAAVTREILPVRGRASTLDASTLDKILVEGPDAGRFLEMLYPNMMSTLPVGKCRYGLMCSENGFLRDDGVVARLSDDGWLCHTTTGGADRIHGHMEDRPQCEWGALKVWTANLTDQYAQIAAAGPKARATRCWTSRCPRAR